MIWFIVKGLLRDRRWTILGRYIGGANVVTAQYVRKVVPGRVSLAAEYQAQLGTGSQVSP